MSNFEVTTEPWSERQSLLNTLLAAGTITASAPVDITQTWNNAAETFTAHRIDVEDTASGSGSLLMDLRVGGESRFYVGKSGRLSFREGAAGPFHFYLAGNQCTMTGNHNVSLPGLYLWRGASHGGMTIGFGENTADLHGDAVNVLALRRGVNPQEFRLYNTYTDASNYERGFMRWSSNVLEIGTGAAGTGILRDINIGNSMFGIRVEVDNDMKLGGGTTAGVRVNGNSNSFYSFCSVFQLSNLPTADPAVAGRIWNDAGTLKISAG